VRFAHGQCIEHYGAGEAYLPLLSALGQLGREPGHERLVEVLQQYAPTWLVQLPALLDAPAYEALQRKTRGATRERMLREMAEALEVFTTEQSLVLLVEDLHWSDPSTLEFLAFVARRRQPARVCIIGTYRPVEMLTEGHPLQGVTHELFAHDLGRELALSRLREADVAAYLTLRFPESVLPTRLGQVLYQRTGGTPLFLASLVQDLISREVLFQGEDSRWVLQGDVTELETWTPESVRHVLARQRARLTPNDQQVLAAASLAGLEFSAAAVAAALETKVIQVEERCGRLAEQQQFLRPAGISEWPDGTRAARYGFLHALYQEFWHERVSVGKQQQWHLRMGERKEAAYGRRANEIAVELALHFEQGQDYRRAVQYLRQAGENALQRSANQEAISHLTKGLELLKTLPDMPERVHQELTLQLALRDPLVAIKGYAAPEVERTRTRALELCRQVGNPPELFWALTGLCSFYLLRAELKAAREWAEQCFSLAQNVHHPIFLMYAHLLLGSTSYYLGEFAQAREHWEAGIAFYDPPQHRNALEDPGVLLLSYAAWVLWFLGYPDQALQRIHAALTLAQELSRPFSLAYALNFAGVLHQLRREEQVVRERVEALVTLSTEQGFPLYVAMGTIRRGWALAAQEQVERGILQIRQGMAAYQAMGTELGQPHHLAYLAEACGKTGQTEEGLSALAEALALVDKTGERFYEAELYRLKGELTLKQFGVRSPAFGVTNPQSSTPNPQAEAEACFLKAIKVARRQQAKSWELRATVSLARLWQQGKKKQQARKMLAKIYNWFTEGFDTKDLQEAKALLEELH
jgi:predicted ATPase